MFNWAPASVLDSNKEYSINVSQKDRAIALSLDNEVGRRIFHIQASPDANISASLSAELGTTLPLSSSVVSDSSLAALWTGPNEWLVFCDHDVDAVNLKNAWSSPREDGSVITELTDYYAIFHLSGEQAIDLLQEGCGADLQSDAFHPGAFIITLLFDVTVLIYYEEKRTGYTIYVDRSLARHLWLWLSSHKRFNAIDNKTQKSISGDGNAV